MVYRLDDVFCFNQGRQTNGILALAELYCQPYCGAFQVQPESKPPGEIPDAPDTVTPLKVVMPLLLLPKA